MKQNLNPAVLALELELRQVRAEAAYYKDCYKYQREMDSPLRFDANGLDLGTKDMPSRIDTVTLPIRAEIKAATENGFDIRVTARTIEPGGKGIGLQYFNSAREIFSPRDQAVLLGHMHEHFIHQLVEFIRNDQP